MYSLCCSCSKESASADVASSNEECFLCDASVEVRFEPCGHAILCSACAERAKKCPKCKVQMDGMHIPVP